MRRQFRASFNRNNGHCKQQIEYGELAEWSKAPLLKSGKPQGFLGSNPRLSANSLYPEKYPSGEGAPLLRE